MFTVIAERINMTRKRIRAEVAGRNADFIRGEVVRQERAGATHIDVNAGGDPAKEVEDMRWLVDVVSGATELPLSIDSTSAEAVRAGLERCCRRGTIVNSITNERQRVEGFLPLVKEFATGVIALTMDDSGMPQDLAGRTRITDDLVSLFAGEDIPLERVYFDLLVQPVSTSAGAARDVLNAVRYVKDEYPQAHIALGASNVSFGLPERRNLNLAFLAMLVEAGCDGAIIDPCQPGTMAMLHAARAIAGADEYCMEYLTAKREGRLT